MEYNTLIKQLGTMIAVSLMSMPVMAQSLEQAVAETLVSNPEIKSAFNEFMSRNSMIDAAKGDYLPSVDLRAGVGYNNYDNEFGTKGEYTPKQAEISIRQLLWDGSITWNNINRNQSETEAQRYQLLSDAQDKALKTAEVYLDVLRAEAILQLSESNYKVHQRMYVDIKKRADAGIGSTADLAQVEGRLARSKTNLLAAESNLNDKKTEFIRTVGTFPDGLVTPEVDANFIPTSLDDAMKIAQKNNPVMYVASNDIDAAEYQYKQAKGNFYPTFDIEASQEWGNELNGSRGDTDEFKATLNMRYNLFNGGSDAAKSRQAAYQLNKSKDIRDRALRMLNEGTKLSWSAMELANNQKKYLQEHVDTSARTVIAYEKQFKIGQRTLLDVLNSENELFDSRKAYLNAHYDGIFAKYRVLNATGTILNEMRVDVPNEWTESVK